MLRALFLVAALPLLACEPTNQGYAPPQPIKYSHAVHAGALQIPCQYCHVGAERSRHAGIPAASTCMNCHKQVLPEHEEIKKVKAAIEKGEPIAWARVHQLPDHAYFNHKAHVGAGVACQTCHGPVESMGRLTQSAPLTMGWCLSCHRQGAPARGRSPEVGPGGPGGGSAPLHSGARIDFGRSVKPAQYNRLTDCAVCHH